MGIDACSSGGGVGGGEAWEQFLTKSWRLKADRRSQQPVCVREGSHSIHHALPPLLLLAAPA